jgi:hypothetical protein
MPEELNPYSAPAEIAAPNLRPQPARKSPWGETFQSARGRAYLSIGVSAVHLVLCLLLMLALFGQVQLLEKGVRGEGITPDEANLNGTIVTSLGVGTMIVALLGLLFLLLWIHAAYKNLRSLGTRQPKFTPGWAVGWWFIPIMNLFKPCEAMMELSRASDPRALPIAGARDRRPKDVTLIVTWWIWRLVSAILGQILMRYTPTENLTELINYTWVLWVAILVADIPVVLLQTLVVLGIDKDQEARHQLIEQAAAEAIPGGLAVEGPMPIIEL